MASRKDELRAYQFLKQRAVSALVVHETDPEQPPFRRPMLAAFWGIAVAMLGLAIAGAVGLFTGDDKAKLQAGKSVIVVDPGAARYIYLQGKLHPVKSYGGALLALGKNVKTQSVDSSDIQGIPKGRTLGIPDAPDSLPSTDELLTQPWSMCSRPSTDANGVRVDTSELMVGQTAPGGTPAGAKSLLVSSKGKTWWIAGGKRHSLADPEAALAGLGMTGQPALPVSATWVDAVPEGGTVRPVRVSGIGARSTALAPIRSDVRAGQIFEVDQSATEKDYYVALRDRLVQLTPLQLLVQITAKSTKSVYSGVPHTITLDPGQLSLLTRQPNPASRGDLPVTRPERLTVATTKVGICATFRAGSSTPSFTVGQRLPSPSSGALVGGKSDNGTPLADSVLVPPGRAALVQIVADTSSDPKASEGTVALVTDDGRLFPFAEAEVQKVLGYEKVQPIRISATLASRLPRGPALFTGTGDKPDSSN